jgi:hypothetical protein
MNRVPEYRERARSSLGQEMRERQNQRFQQRLASEQFDFQQQESNREFRLNRQNLKFQQWLAEAGFNLEKLNSKNANNLSWAQLALDQKALDQQRELAMQEMNNAGNGNTDAQAAKRWENGVAALSGYMSPGDDDRYPKGHDKEGPVNPKLWKRNHNPEDLLRTLVGQIRLPRKAALRLIASSSNGKFRNWARGRLGRKGNRTGTVIEDVANNRG